MRARQDDKGTLGSLLAVGPRVAGSGIARALWMVLQARRLEPTDEHGRGSRPAEIAGSSNGG
jgi:hypothetical protein